MRTIVLLDNVSAAGPATSESVNFEQRAEWMLQITSTGLDGTPRLIIEWSIDNTQVVWSPIENVDVAGTYFFPIDDDEISIIDDRCMGKFYRVRLEANGNTTGTVKADLGYKTYP